MPEKFDSKELKFDANGLVPAIAQDYETGQVLMMAWMNVEAIERTISTGRVTYWSRSRAEFWEKGKTSGHVQILKEFRFDCDRDCLLLMVEQTGPACHTNRTSCFYTSVQQGFEVELSAPIS